MFSYDPDKKTCIVHKGNLCFRLKVWNYNRKHKKNKKKVTFRIYNELVFIPNRRDAYYYRN